MTLQSPSSAVLVFSLGALSAGAATSSVSATALFSSAGLSSSGPALFL